MALFPMATRAIWLTDGGRPLPAGLVLRIWTDDAWVGEAQEFVLGQDGAVAGDLRVDGEGADGPEGSRLCRLRVYRGEVLISAAIQAVRWRENRIADPLALGFVVRGRLIIDGRAPSDGGRLEVVTGTGALAADRLAASQPIGADGRFRVTCPTGPGGERPAAVTLRYAAGPPPGNLLPLRILVHPGPDTEVELTGSSIVTGGFAIRGGLLFESLHGLGDSLELRVLLDRLGEHTIFASRTIAVAPRYEVDLPAPPPGSDLTLEVHMPDSDGRRSTLLASSQRFIKPSGPIEADLLIADPAGTLPLFESILARIEPYLAGLSPTALRDEQWAALVAAASLPEAQGTRIRQAAGLAVQLAERTGGEAAALLPSMFVLASGEPLAALIAGSDETQRVRLAAAQEAGEIGREPWRVAAGDGTATTSFSDFLELKASAEAERLLFDTGAPDVPVTARIASLGVADAAKRRLVMGLIDASADLESFRAALAASGEFAEEERSQVLAVHAAASMGDFHAPLLDALTGPAARHVLDRPEAIAAYRTEELAELIRGAEAAPSRYAAAGDPAAAYAQTILDRGFALFHSSAFVARMDALAEVPPPAALAANVLRDHPDFNIYATPVDDHFAASGPGTPPAEDRVALDREAMEALQGAQRLSALTSRSQAPDVVAGLMTMGIGSAHEILAMGKTRFTDAALTRGWQPQRIASVFDGARTIGQLTNLVVQAAVQPDYRLGSDSFFGTRTDVFPKLADLFGSFDSCACVECRSVYSPSAYLTELLRWLELEFIHGSGTGYARLMARRADIAHLELTCENSHTLLPHIDLVLETLEYVASREDLDLAAAAHQTDWRTPELLRDGEHFGLTEIPAYGPGRLLDAVYPWTLPFNLWLAQMRAYLGIMGVKRAELVALAGGLAPWDPHPGLAAETLGLDDLQFAIISGQHVPAGGALAYWDGVDVAAKPVAGILRVSGLDFESLVDILKTEYVRHATGAPVIFSIVFDPDRPCDLSKAHVSPPIAPAHADHIHRLARLRRALGWSWWETDEAILALAATGAGADPLDAACLIRLAGLRRLERDTGIKVTELIAWFGRIPAYRGEAASPYYEAELLDKAGRGQVSALLALAPAPDVVDRQLAVPRAVGGLTAAERDQLREALEMSEADFEAATVSMGEFMLDLDTLTWLYRLNSLARAAGMSAAQLAQVASLAPPPADWTPQTALRFLDFARWLGEAQISWAELHHYLTGDGDGAGLALAGDEVADVAASLYGASGRFHFLLSDPPLPATASLVTPPDRLERLFRGVLGTVEDPVDAALLGAVAAGDRSKFPQATFDPGAHVDSLFPTQPANPPWGFAIADAVRHVAYPRAAGSAATADPLLRTEAEVKSALAVHMAPEIARRALREAALAAYSDLFQLPPDKVAFLLDSVRSTLIPPGATFADILIPAADLAYDPMLPIGQPPDYAALIAELQLVIVRLRRLDLLDAPIADLKALRDEPSPGVAAGAPDALWFDLFQSVPQTGSIRETAVQWRNLMEALALRDTLGVSLAGLVAGLSLAAPGATPAGAALALLLGPKSRHALRPYDEVASLLARLAGQGMGISVARLIQSASRTFESIGRWGLSLTQAIGFAAYPVQAALAAEARQAARGRFTNDALWDKKIVEANNALRTVRRDRLVDFLTARHDLDGPDALYEHFLVDVEMSTCMKTSRLVLAISAVQLFVQRIFLGLEPGMRYDEDQRREWEWMKNFRVWGAARELFLYPESYLVASLRLDKTPFFETLEEELQQGEPSDERLEDCFVRYVEKVADVARLDIRAFCHEPAPPGEKPVLHVVGRTRSEPHRYFHRLCEPGGVWGPWNPIEQDIEGDHLMMVFWNRRGHLLWPTFIERRHGEEDYYEILFNHMSLRSGKWTPKRKLPGKILSGRYCGPGLFNNLDRKTGKLRQLSYDNLTLNESATVKGITGYQYVGPFIIDAPFGMSMGWNDYFIWPPPPTVSKLSDIPNVLSGAPIWARLEIDKLSNWAPIQGDVPAPGAVLDFSMASMRRSAFFFRAAPDAPVGGDLHIEVRREFSEAWEGFHTGYLEAAYEDGLRLSSDGQVTLEPIYVPPRPGNLGQKFLAARPSYTVPDAMKLRNGFDRIEERQTSPHLGGKLYSKRIETHTGFLPDTVQLFGRIESDYELIFEQSHAHHLFPDPFFFEDEAHSYFAAPHPADPQRYRFTSITIPGTPLYLAELNARGVAGLLAPRAEDGPYNAGLRRQTRTFDSVVDFLNRYTPSSSALRPPLPVEKIDFTYGAPSAPYSWEIFFHIPMRIVETLRSAGRFDRALEWVSYVFDPTDQDQTTDPNRYWQIRPFHDFQPKGPIQTLMRLLSTASTPQELAERDALLAQIAIWRKDPFDPHSVCAVRTSGYMLWAFITYVEILIEWGDKLFRQNSRESIAEATQLYTFARGLLGERPSEVAKADAPPKTYDQIRLWLDDFSNVAVEVENNIVAYDLVPGASHSAPIALQAAQSLYFCIPRNPKLMALWDRVEDRLTKIRRCLNIDGMANELPLFAARIDPGLLVRARAAGLDISDVLADLAAPRAPYRFTYLIEKAQQFAGEVRSLGGAVLSALEKKDAEELAQLRSQHEISIQKAMRNVRIQQRDQARAQVESLKQNRKSVEVRMAAYAARQPMIGPERKQLVLLQVSQGLATVQAVLQGVSSLMHALDVDIGAPCNSKSIRPGMIVGAIAGMVGSTAGAASLSSSMAGLTAAAERRKEEWDLQVTLAGEELRQIDKQLIAAEIGVAIAELELENLDRQIEQSNEVLSFLKIKFSNGKLYSFMASRLAALHHQAYDLAFDLAKKAQAAFADELGRLDADFVRFGHWDGQKQGLLAGEALGLQLRQMEAAYIEGNRRTYEARRPVSLALLDPAALAALIAEGRCEFELPEWLFDRDLPGLYDRRIKTLTLSLPCVVGPHVPLHAKLTLLSHQIRRKPSYAEPPDLRFDALQSIVTSSGLNDSGLFETGLQDARYLPFEGCGAVARFRLEIPTSRQFDLTTLSDVILSIAYTAREGGDLFRQDVAAELAKVAAKPRLIMSFRHDFPDRWQQFLTSGAAKIAAFAPVWPSVPPEREPYAARPAAGAFQVVQAWARLIDGDGIHKLVPIDHLTMPVESVALDKSLPFFGTDGLKWIEISQRRDVVDLVLVYEKK